MELKDIEERGRNCWVIKTKTRQQNNDIKERLKSLIIIEYNRKIKITKIVLYTIYKKLSMPE